MYEVPKPELALFVSRPEVIGGDQTWLLDFLGSFYVQVYFVTDACLLFSVCVSFLILSQEIGWEERL